MLKFLFIISILTQNTNAYTNTKFIISKSNIINNNRKLTALNHRNHDHSHGHSESSNKSTKSNPFSESFSLKSLKEDFKWKNLFTLPRLGVLVSYTMPHYIHLFKEYVCYLSYIRFIGYWRTILHP